MHVNPCGTHFCEKSHPMPNAEKREISSRIQPHPPSPSGSVTRTTRSSAQPGFTLVELLCVLALLSIVTLLAAPSFGRQIGRLRVHQSTSELKGALLLARSEAVRRGDEVKVRKYNALASDTCGSTASDWSCGWIVFIDQNGNNTFESGGEDGDELVQTFTPAHGTSIRYTSNASVLTVNRWGAINGVGASFVISNSFADSSMIICVSSGGRIRSLDGNTCT